MKRHSHTLPRLLALLTALALNGAHAAEDGVQQLESVQVEMVKDPAAMPYARMNELLRQLEAHGQGLFAMRFKVSRKDGKSMEKTKLALVQDEDYRPIVRDAQGWFTLPTLPPEQAKTAELASNMPKGQVALEGRIYLTTPPERLTLAEVRRIVDLGRRLRSEMLPWYLRWMFPQIEGVRVCSSQAAWELQWREAGRGLLALPLSAESKERDPEQAKSAPAAELRPCTVLRGDEPWPDAARLEAPADTTLSVRLLNAR